MRRVNARQEMEVTTWDWLKALSARPDRLTLVSHAARPGIARFWMTLEHTFFKPDTPANDEFEIVFVEWPDPAPSILWAIAVLPWSLFGVVKTETAPSAGMRIADGVPTTFDSTGKMERFPLDHPHVWGVENLPGSPVYLPGGDAFIHAEESRWIKDFNAKLARGEKPL